MIIYQKKTVFHELARALFLLLHFDPDTTSRSLMQRVRAKGFAALKMANAYIGPQDDKDIKAFLESKPLKFTIPCGKDIVRGDTIRFAEIVLDNRRNPPRNLGKRGVTAKVTAVRKTKGQQMLDLEVIESGGVWCLARGTTTSRTLNLLSQCDVMRIAWEDESKRSPRI